MTCTATRHDTVDAYSNHGCRCPEARRLKVLEWNRYLLRRMRGESLFTDSTGTVRRIQSLLALGWRYSDLGARLGISGSAVSKLTGRPVVHVKTAQAVRRLYDDLADHRGPSATSAKRAAAAGWLVPLWWDDDQIDDPAYDPRLDIIPDEVSPRRERRQARVAEVHRLTEQGLSIRDIAIQLRMQPRQVDRDRAAFTTANTRPTPDRSEATG